MTTEATCVHRWQLEPGIMHDVPGQCSKCGATRTFKGIIDWDEGLKKAKFSRFGEHGQARDANDRAVEEVMRRMRQSWYEAF